MVLSRILDLKIMFDDKCKDFWVQIDEKLVNILGNVCYTCKKTPEKLNAKTQKTALQKKRVVKTNCFLVV